MVFGYAGFGCNVVNLVAFFHVYFLLVPDYIDARYGRIIALRQGESEYS